MSSHDFHNVDDLMAIADAVGVTEPAQPAPEGKLLVHPSLRAHLDNRLDEVLETWSWRAVGIDPADLPIGLIPADPQDADLVPPEDVDVCEYCDGDGDREVLLDGEYRHRLCSWCGGTGIRPVADLGGEL